MAVAEEVKLAARRFARAPLEDGYKAEALHEYTDSAGEPLYWRIRLKNAETGEKWIRPMMRTSDGFALREPEFPGGKPLYRLHELAARPQDMVVIVEGELKADRVSALGLLATTSGGAGSADAADWSHLAGREVLIWPDKDGPGQDYANAVRTQLVKLDCHVRMIDVNLLELPDKGDAVDWLRQHPDTTASDVLALPTQGDTAGALCNAPDIGDSCIDWPEPGEISAPLRPVPPFAADAMLPPVLRDFVLGEAERMPCPPDYIAAALMVALGSVIGAQCAIKPKSRDSWLVVSNLWGALVGPPASKKSPAMAAALRPIDRLIEHATEAYRTDEEAFRVHELVRKAQIDALEGKIKGAAKGAKNDEIDKLARELTALSTAPTGRPVCRRFRSNDSTVEKLGELLRDNPAGILVLRDELVGLLSSWDREGREGERAFYLEAWNGTSSFSTDRIGRGSIQVPNLCVSVLGGIQPDKLVAYLQQAASFFGNDGMLQRFQLMVYPDAADWEWRDRAPSMEISDQVNRVFERLGALNPLEWGASPADESARFPFFRFDDRALEVFVEFSTALHRVKLPNEDQPLIAQHLAKFDKLFPAIALILHLVDCVTTGGRGAVPEAAALRAQAWCDHLEAHARRCYGLLIDDGLRSAQCLADRIQQGKLKDGFTAADVKRAQWRNLKEQSSIRAALEWLEQEGWIRGTEVRGRGPGFGRPTVRFAINPRLSMGGRRSKGDE
jgi:hypothetical protein